MKKIPLTQGKFAVVDDEDFDRLSRFKWHFDGTRYARRSEKTTRTNIAMHNEILDVPKGFQIDHKDRDGLNNVKSNLRICTESENKCNRSFKIGVSGYRGVWKNGNKWEAYLKIGDRRIYGGVFSSKEDAAKARDDIARKYHKEFADLNFVNE
jgi:hypothetical protein